MNVPLDTLVRRITQSYSTESDLSFTGRVMTSVMQSAAERLLAHLDDVSSGYFQVSDTRELASLVGLTLQRDRNLSYSLTICEPQFRVLASPVRKAAPGTGL